ncbi:MAG: GTPase HflX [Candidatus Omnitrophota bacterium]
MEKALLVTVDLGKRESWTAEDKSGELAELAKSAGAKVIREEIVKRHAICPATFIGEGKVEELAAFCKAEGIKIVIFNNDLTGTQANNLAEAFGIKAIDRTQLILDIFASRAHSNEGKVQVELAQLMYLLPRLTGKGEELSRLGGGIGTRGPGEQKLEVDRRRIRSRISRLKSDLDGLEKRRDMMRKRRERFAVPMIAIAGYTNAGKSTLLNALTGSDVSVKDKLFATLDPTVRRFRMPSGQETLFVDTVGFITELPHNLIEAFKATLEEVANADIILHVVDASNLKAIDQAQAAYKVFEEIGAGAKPIITVLNKTDKVVDLDRIAKLKAYFKNAVAISALKKEGFDKLIDAILVSKF